MSILRIEQRHGSRISSELDSKLEWYGRISTTLSGKLESLRSLSRIGYEVKEFADKITGSWVLANKQVSRTRSSPGVESLITIPRFPGLRRVRENSCSKSNDIGNPPRYPLTKNSKTSKRYQGLAATARSHTRKELHFKRLRRVRRDNGVAQRTGQM